MRGGEHKYANPVQVKGGCKRGELKGKLPLECRLGELGSLHGYVLHCGHCHTDIALYRCTGVLMYCCCTGRDHDPARYHRFSPLLLHYVPPPEPRVDDARHRPPGV